MPGPLRSMASLLAICYAFTQFAALSATPVLDLQGLFPRQANTRISSDGSCGAANGATTCLGSEYGNCCSRISFCGANSSYCGSGCQSAYGLCGNPRISTDGSCGGLAGLTCLGAAMGNCCSQQGFCGETATYCGAGCQSAFGDCFGASASATGVRSTAGVSGAGATPTSGAQSAGPGAAQGSSSGNGDNNMGVKIGLGVGIPLGVLAIGAVVWLLVRRRKKKQEAERAMPPLPPPGVSMHDTKNEFTDDVSPVTPTPMPIETRHPAEMDGSNGATELGSGEIPHELPAQPYR